MLVFTAKGLLTPPQNIQSDLSELEEQFVNKAGTKIRKELFSKYIHYSKTLKEICGETGLLQWINGSFVSKVSEPKDIDLVTFINFDIIENNKDELAGFKYPASLENYGVDAYIVKVYPVDHKNYSLYAGDRAYWMDKFDKTRRNRIGHQHRKGFLEIIL